MPQPQPLRTHRLPAITSIVLAATVALAVAACGGIGATASTQVDAEAALCTSLDTFKASVATLTGLDPATASIEDVQAARAAAGTAWDGVKAAAAAIPEADEAALETAFQGLAASVDDVPTDVPVADVVAGVKTAGAEIPAAIDEMRNGVGCQ